MKGPVAEHPSIYLLNSGRRKKEQTVHRYMQEIRDISHAGFNRREFLRLGLVAGSAGLAALAGAPTFKPYWAHAEDLELFSPANTPWRDPLYIPPALTPTALNPAPARGPNPTPSQNTVVLDKGDGPFSPFGFREAPRPDHQRWTQFGGASSTLPGFSGKMYESIEMCVMHNFYPAGEGAPYPIWTFVETSTGKVGPFRINARYGEPVVHRIHNALPADNHGFGINQTSTHLHNGHTPSESDGGPTHFYDTGLFKDYHYPNVRAGFTKPGLETTRFNGKEVQGDYRETLGFLWFHDHRFDFTAQNVYKGLTGFYPLFSDDLGLDTGDENTGLHLPSGEYDIPIIFADKVFDPSTGELFFDLFNLDGILGDKLTVNGKIQPFLEVKRRKYRFRLLDGGPSRFYEFFLSSGQPLIQISADGNLLPRPLTRQSIRIGVAERVDVIVDFSGASPGQKIYLENRLEQVNGRGPTGKIIAPTPLVEFRVVGDAPDCGFDATKPLLPLPSTNVPVAQRREWQFGRSNGAWTVNGEFFDPNVISAFPKLNTAEQWTLKTGGGWSHPIHIHLEEFQLQSRDGKPVPDYEVARKDVVRIGNAAIGERGTSEAQVFMQFRDFLGDYPLHCHNTVHEDHAMMVRWQVVP